MESEISRLSNELTPRRGRDRVLILVKALPHVGERHGETVCCAGVTVSGEWRRQYPIHFRRLRDNQFSRWQWIEYDWIAPGSDDKRAESRRVQEDTIQVCDKMPEQERAGFLNQIITSSTTAAAARGMTLTLVRPTRSRFRWRAKTHDQIERERKGYEFAARQISFLDRDLIALQPCPVAFHFEWTDADGQDHRSTCDDWETAAMFYRREKSLGTQAALDEMSRVFNEQYPARGMAFAMGTHSRRREQWLLVGVLRLDATSQLTLRI